MPIERACSCDLSGTLLPSGQRLSCGAAGEGLASGPASASHRFSSYRQLCGVAAGCCLGQKNHGADSFQELRAALMRYIGYGLVTSGVEQMFARMKEQAGTAQNMFSPRVLDACTIRAQWSKVPASEWKSLKRTCMSCRGE
eukprot:6471177-Amphidinium_carterae.2